MSYQKLVVLMGVISVFVSSAFAITFDNGLLSKMYTQVDDLYAAHPEQLLRTYERLPYIQVKFANNTKTAYYLDKLSRYIKAKLFTFDQQPNFVCLDDYVQKGDTVEIDYTLKKIDETLVATTLVDIAREHGRSESQVNNILAFNAGNGKVLPGIDNAVIGTQLHDRVGAVLAPSDAYGTYDPALLMSFSAGNIPVEVQATGLGKKVLLGVSVDGETKMLIGTVTAKSAASVTVDFNHPLAGETLSLILQTLKLFKACGH